MKIWHTAWAGADIVVYRDGQAVDSLPADAIERIVCVYREPGRSPGDLSYSIVELEDSAVLLPAECGFAGRVHFERADYWQQRGCIWWVAARRAVLPPPFRPVGWWIRRAASPAYRRVARAELAGAIERWPLEGPQTWQERKWARIERQRPFTSAAPGQP